MFELPLLDELEEEKKTVDKIFFLQDHISSFRLSNIYFTSRNGKLII